MHQIDARRNTFSKFFIGILLYAPFITICGIIFWLSGMSHPPIPSIMKFHHGDKVMHLIAFFFVGFTAVLPLGFQKKFFKFWLSVRALGLAAAYAAVDEIHQAFVPMRSSSTLDLTADLIGASLGIFVFWLMVRLTRAIKKKKAPENKFKGAQFNI